MSSRLPKAIALRIQSENAFKRGIREYSVTSSENPDSQRPAENKKKKSLVAATVANIEMFHFVALIHKKEIIGSFLKLPIVLRVVKNWVVPELEGSC